MKLYAQQGYGDGDKTDMGLSEGSIQGAIFSPKDLIPKTTVSRMEQIGRTYPGADVFLDPQFYVNLHADNPDASLGKLTEWDFFTGVRRSQLEDSDQIDRVLGTYMQCQTEMPVTAVIAPNIYISRSFDSIEAAIAKSFLRRAQAAYGELHDDRPLYASLIVSREALLQEREFDGFLNDLTAMPNPPHGLYLVIGSRSPEIRTDVFHADVISRWMLMNYALSINGVHVVNGYSDILTPVLGVAGGQAGATGWWSNLRRFSMERFLPSRSGGRLPTIRYLSTALLNRITWAEKRAFEAFAPEIVNGLSHDADYEPEPHRSLEVLQSWEALKDLIDNIVRSDIKDGLACLEDAVDRAGRTYMKLKSRVPLDPKSNEDHVDAIGQGIKEFRVRAEL